MAASHAADGTPTSDSSQTFLPVSATAQVVEAARRGSAEAWEVIFSHFFPAIVRYASSRGVADPEDVAQEVMAAAASGIADFVGGWTELRTWLFSIAFRRCADHHRRRYRNREVAVLDLPDRPDPGGSSEDPLWRALDRREVMTSLSILSERERSVVTLRFVAELSVTEVAEITGLTPGNVRVIQSRAITRLRRHLEHGGGFLDRRFRLLPPVLVDVWRWLRRHRHFGTPAAPVASSASAVSASSVAAGVVASAVAAVAVTAAGVSASVSGSAGAVPGADGEMATASTEAVVVEPADAPMSDSSVVPSTEATSPIQITPEHVPPDPAVSVATTAEPPLASPLMPDELEHGPDGSSVENPASPASSRATTVGDLLAIVELISGVDLGGLGGVVSSAVDGVAQAVIDLPLADLTTQVTGTASGTVDAVTDTVSQATSSLSDTATATGEASAAAVEAATNTVDETVSSVPGPVGDVASAATGAVSEVADGAVEAATEGVSETTSGVSEVVDATADAVDDVVSDVAEVVDNTVAGVEEVVDDLADGLIGGLIGG